MVWLQLADSSPPQDSTSVLTFIVDSTSGDILTTHTHGSFTTEQVGLHTLTPSAVEESRLSLSCRSVC